MGKFPRAVWLCGLLLVIVIQAGAASAEDVQESDVENIPVEPARQELVVGERLAFHGRWFGIPVGKGWIEVKERTSLDGRPVYHIEAEGVSTELLSQFYPIHDVVHSYLEADSLRPLQFQKSQREGHYRADEIVTFDYDRLVAHYHSLLNGQTKDVPVPPDLQDLVSVFYWLRRQPVTVGRPLTVNIYSDEKVYRTEILPMKAVVLELLKRGTFATLLVEPKAKFKGLLVKRGRMWVYVTADARRLPLYVRVATPWGPMSLVIDEESLRQP